MSDENKIYIRDLIKYSFYIPNYQRGYKWSKENIKDLLNDINSIDNDNKKDHCLHNLTIIEKNGKYEVVDGQQRLTTIFLLLKYLGYEEIYNLDYQIREETRNFIYNKLRDVINLIKDIENSENNEKIKAIFTNLIKYNNKYNKQDIYFICDALFCMHQWFTDNTDNKIYDNLQNVYFYKHELTGIKGETVFANLNSGKVPLTDIELIKADLIINISEEKNKSLNNDILLNEIRINIGRLWDEMESFLAQDEVWYWIAANNKSANKLSLLFDLINIKTFSDYKKCIKENNKTSNDILENKENNKTSNDILDDIKDYYYTIKDWYYDNDMYHLVGIAVNIGLSINSLFEIEEDSKDKLKKKIIQSIIKKLKIDDKDSLKKTLYEDLNYNNNKNDIKNIMLLLNCFEGYNFDEQLSFNKGFRYRFDLHNKEEWSIEHIFPQKIKNSGDKEKYEKYIKSYLIDLISYLLLDKESNQSQENLKMVLNTLNNEIDDKSKINIDNIIDEINNFNKKYDINDIINKIKTVIENNNFNEFQKNMESGTGFKNFSQNKK
ncbi:DUF262 domain-containing protein [Brachyspira hyodysenteriae]|uniref:DUF262 domain-containing protein n=1 Tax=Brachyspira hyodysenteriae TaxID=159 RepID=UPI0022CDAEE7|nr:DUF262 domain-containing protein [Brachyspira hyodysenteriae]MCZ9839072.1 DUF262 domain-containing protein [Brachyspira hyodysenteriae]MCZ9847691.1 DUF262 domain-containing protein [Brachyspira hyodysenteriae]MCZ9872418.1 DUF262 domain-containing protein [Brachyspira hyodysenteriae]MCZ9929393.1 DUF262 domain-containing protein [Brachyspira hyodysenteriae]MCZ9991014.1 DUF262 domain-containing protein [Brachyspira hyodysenteriae]